MKLIINLVASLLIILVSGVAFYFISLKPEVPKIKIEKKGLPVEIIKASTEDEVIRLKLWGEVKSRRLISVKSEVEGKVLKVNPYLRPGYRVNTGDVLLELDKERLVQRLAQLEATKNALQADLEQLRIESTNLKEELKLLASAISLAKEDVERHEALVKKNHASKLTLSSFRQILLRQQSSHQQTLSRLNLLPARISSLNAQVANSSAAIKLLKRDISDSIIKAPFEGVIGGDVATLGDYLKKGDSIGTLLDPHWHEVWAHVGINEKSKLGSVSAISFNGELVKDFRFTGSMDKATQSEIMIFEVKGREMKAGELIELEVTGQTLQNIILLPQSALRNDRQSVYIVKDSKLVIQKVDVLMINEGFAYCSGGLSPSDEVVVNRLANPAAGSAVTIVGGK